MAATPKSGVVTFQQADGSTIGVDVYVSDVVGALVNFDGGNGAGATSPTDFTLVQPSRLIDFTIVTGTQDTTKLQVQRSGKSTGSMLRYDVNLTTLAKRQPCDIRFAAGDKITLIQR